MPIPKIKRRSSIDVPALLDRLGIKFERVAPTKLVAFCPHPDHDNKRTPAWFIRDDLSSAYHSTHCCKSCGFKGGAATLASAVLGLSIEDAREWIENERKARPLGTRIEVEVSETRFVRKFELPAGSVPIVSGDEASDYLEARGVLASQIIDHELTKIPTLAKDEDGRPHPLRGRIVFPFVDLCGAPISYTARSWGDSRKRYKTASSREGASPAAIFGESKWTEDDVAVVVCEGVFDGLSVERAFEGELAFAVLAGSEPHPSQLLKLESFERVVVATDSDPAGDKAWRIIRDSLEGKCSLRRARPPEGRDLGDMSAAEVRDLIAAHVRGMV